LVAILGIEHNVLSDAPFIGAVIIAKECLHNCTNCINEHLKKKKPIKRNALSIIGEVLDNQLNEGIILAGLEWTYDPDGLRELVNVAIEQNLQVMIYTYMEEEQFKQQFNDIYQLPIWIKFGEYKEELKTYDNVQFGVRLASSNQYIKFLGKNN
jgi:pyruvate-formate lyase-activating enzyme